MTISPGTRLGPYEIVALLGAGGMGEVYRARDGKLNREVAIKVLPASVAGDGDRLARFHREAQVLASLNHPNIAHIHGFEDSGGIHAIVMELVEGPTLADRIARGPLPLDEALPIARQIADALEAAHDRGIVHRDLKPANIKVRPDGTVKVLDFGLAKAVDASVSADLSRSPTITSPAMTHGGAILGTAAYMSPEQARGRAVDKRADIWAFGAILYEMLTGQLAFKGDTVSDLIAAVLTREIDWTALPPVPAGIRRLLHRCLQKDANLRLRDIGDARLELIEAQSPDTTPSAQPIAVPIKRRTWPLTIAAVALLAVSGAAVAFALRKPAAVVDDQSQPRWRGLLLGGPMISWTPRLAPDGRTLAFIAFIDGLTQVAVMNQDSGNWRALTQDRTRGYVIQTSWSNDGSRLYYNRFTDVPVGIYSVSALGGDERLVLENAIGGEPMPDGSLLVGKINDKRQIQVHRYWPGEDRTEALPALISNPGSFPLRVTPDGASAIFWGQALDEAPSNQLRHLYRFNVSSGTLTTLRSVVVDDTDPIANDVVALTRDGHAVLVTDRSGDLTTVMSIDLAHPDRTRIVAELPALTGPIDVGPDGSLYVSQNTRAGEVWRLAASGADAERLFTYPHMRSSSFGSSAITLHAADGRTWLAVIIGGHRRILVADPHKEAVPFIDTNEDTGEPMSLLGADRLAFVIGTGEARRVAIASAQDGRIVRRLQGIKPQQLSALVGSRDGTLLYYVESGVVWRISTDDGEPRKVVAGDGVAIAPDNRSLIIQLVEATGVRWIRTDLDGGGAQPIPVRSDVSFTYAPVSPGAVAPDGRIALPISLKDSWFWGLGIFDPRTGLVSRVPLPVIADPPAPAWTQDGKIIVLLHRMEASLWRYTPTSGTQSTQSSQR